MKSVRFGIRSLPAAMAIVTIAAYGLLLPFTGFYWDDWPFAWTARFLGPAAFIPAFRGFRPFLGPIFFFTTSLIPPDPMLWQIFALVIRVATALAFWYTLDRAWPRHRPFTVPTAFLFLVFPGYSQHWVAFTHINQEWIPLIFYLLSIGLSLRAFRAGRSPLRDTLLALIFLIVGLFPTEYFIGLEPVRAILFWVVASEAAGNLTSRVARVLRSWWPYLAIWVLDLAWLVYFYRSGVYVSYDLTASGAFPPLLQSLLIFADALWKAGFFVWFQLLILAGNSIRAPSTLTSLGLAALAFMAAAIYLFRSSPWLTRSAKPAGENAAASSIKADDGKSADFALPALVIGLVGIVLGRVPSFAAGLPLTLQSSYDRFMISMMLGGSLFISGLGSLLIRNVRLRTYAFAVLLALGIGQQFFNANIFRRDWEGQQQIYWEMAWRMPALQPGTALITQQMPLDYETDLSMTAALNWIYSSKPNPTTLPYALVYSEKRLGGFTLPNLSPGTLIQLPFRTVAFAGNTSDTVTIYVPRNGCLRVLDPSLGDAATYSGYPASVTDPIGLSNPSLIVSGAADRPLPDPPFGSEPAHTWCYFYEKAELARQTGDWQQVTQIGASAARQGFTPEDPIEWLPFIEAYARTGNTALAQSMTRQAWDSTAKVHHGLCTLWSRLQDDGPDAARNAASQLIGELGCGH